VIVAARDFYSEIAELLGRDKLTSQEANKAFVTRRSAHLSMDRNGPSVLNSGDRLADLVWNKVQLGRMDQLPQNSGLLFAAQG